jgi:hypothetical protein
MVTPLIVFELRFGVLGLSQRSLDCLSSGLRPGRNNAEILADCGQACNEIAARSTQRLLLRSWAVTIFPVPPQFSQLVSRPAILPDVILVLPVPPHLLQNLYG